MCFSLLAILVFLSSAAACASTSHAARAQLLSPKNQIQHSDGDGPRRSSAIRGLRLRVYNNTALFGLPIEVNVIDGFNFSFPGNAPFSAELTGTMALPDATKAINQERYYFECDFGAATVGFLFVDDHMVCQTGAYSVAPKVTGVDNPMRKLSKAMLPIRLEIFYSSISDQMSTLTDMTMVNVSVRVTSNSSSSADEMSPVLSPDLPEPERRRRELQRNLARGWGMWNHHTLLDQVHLPSGVRVTTAICSLDALGPELDSNLSIVEDGCIEVARPDDNARAGILAYDYSFGQFTVTNYSTAGQDKPLNVSISSSGGDQLMMTFDLVGGDSGRYAVVVLGSALWHRAANVTAADDVLTFSPWGLPQLKIYAAATKPQVDVSVSASTAQSRRMQSYVRPSIILPLVKGQKVGLSSQRRMPVTFITSELEAKKAAEVRRYSRYGEMSEVKAAVQAAVMWNLVYVPAEAGPLAPVSRGWGSHLCRGAISQEWCYIQFEWDNIFASYMLSLDAKDLAYSNFIQVIKSKTANGFVPNFACATDKSEDRTEPPVGAKVLLEMYRRHQDEWLVELLFDDLLDWNNWFMTSRILPPLGLIALGGSSMQNARYESGLDNSPMYDGDFFQTNTSQMLLYDVGMSSLLVVESEALAELAEVISRPESAFLLKRSSIIRKRIKNFFGDSDVFVNRFAVNASFYRRVSPTSFYPMLAGAASADQVNEMVSKWLLNSSRFCISPEGDFAGNSNGCYWGLPSISADDPAYLKGRDDSPGFIYWRGNVWGPMAQLVYWGLRRYDFVPAARKARKALCKQLTSMMLEQWDSHGHICENYGPRKESSDCTGNRFYHWGALAGFISLLEDEYY